MSHFWILYTWMSSNKTQTFLWKTTSKKYCIVGIFDKKLFGHLDPLHTAKIIKMSMHTVNTMLMQLRSFSNWRSLWRRTLNIKFWCFHQSTHKNTEAPILLHLSTHLQPQMMIYTGINCFYYAMQQNNSVPQERREIRHFLCPSVRLG
jgi:hypothetical protein